jgi:NADH-quinone oxidoreductase subunit G
MKMPKIIIDGISLEVEEGMTILKAAERVGVHVPRFCYHPAFVPEGSCRLCYVEIEGCSKLELSCSTVVKDGMNIATRSPRAVAARRSVLEFLLAEHPLDCPICDKAGECKLQDYAWEHGLVESEFREVKEKREKKIPIAARLVLDRERCVLCTRCVRFLEEITATRELGLFERGIRAEVSTYNGELVQTHYSGNLTDLCPVGAITDTEFRFKARTWFLTPAESICPLCSRGCHIYIDYHSGFPRQPGSAKVYRIRPRVNDAVNGPWICDMGRYGFVDRQQNNRWSKLCWNKGDPKTELNWEKALDLIAARIRSLREGEGKPPGRITMILTSWLTNEELYLIKKMFQQELNVTDIYFADPKPGAGDDFLLRPERSPNRRGALEMGYDLKPVVMETAVRDTDMLLVFGPFIAESSTAGKVGEVIVDIPAKILITSHESGLESLFDFVLPSAFISEKSGSLTNIDGRIQKFRAAVPQSGSAKPEWEILLELAKSLPVFAERLGRWKDPFSIFEDMGKEVPFFGIRT